MLVYVIVSFCWDERGGVVHYWVLSGFFGSRVCFSLLREYGSHAVCGGVRGEEKWGGVVRLLQDWFPAHDVFKHLESVFLRGMPVEWGHLLGEVDEGSGDLGVVGDEVAIESCESQECSDVSHVLRAWPVCYSFDFGGVHLYCTVF